MVLIDGRSVYTPLFSGVFWDQQDYLLEDIDRIEVVSGPGGTLWGANAVNGVINIITKSAKETQGLYLEGGGGSELRGFGAIRYGGAINSNVFFRVYGKYLNRDAAVFPNGDGAGDSWWMEQGGFRLDAEPSSQDRFTLQGDAYYNNKNLPTGGYSEANGNNVLGRWTRVFSDTSDFSLQMYYDRTHLRNDVPANDFAPAGVLREDLHTYDLDFQQRFYLGERNEIVWGLGYRFTRDIVDDAPALAFSRSRLDQHLYSGFIQDRVALLENVWLTLGTKIEHNDYTGFEYEPSGRLAWVPKDGHTLWGAISRAIRAPSRFDRDLRFPTPGAAPLVENLLVGGTNFQSETVIAYELGYRTRLADRVSGSISAFYNAYDNLRSTSSSPPPALFGLPLYFDNNLEGETYGFELSVQYQVLDWWRVQANYTLLKEDIRVKSGRTDFNNALNETADPEHQVGLRSSMDLPGNIELDLGLRWIDSFVFNDVGTPATVPDYFELDARIAWRPTRNVELSIVGQNLLHDHHLEYVISSPNPREEIERGVYARIAVQW
ncbi:MAG TPA: TonB-dependent receptor [Verrucomicrobiota bacterium]|nr:TonB-dependent receptor [Verrucomicrobiota bacterium]